MTSAISDESHDQLQPDAPIGDVTPDGGFASQLPTDDALPDFIDPDPCKSPEQVAKLPGIVVGRTLAKQLGVHIASTYSFAYPQSRFESRFPK